MKRSTLGLAGRAANTGFGLVETLVCIAILAILLSMTVAPLRSAIVRQRIAGVHLELVTAIQWARWEALRRNTLVTLQRRTDCDTALPGDDHWSCGWQLVAGEDLPVDIAATPQAVLQSFTVPPGLRLLHPGGGQRLQFTRTGYPRLVAHRFVVGLPGEARDTIDPRHARTLCINRTGRVRHLQEQTTC